MSKFLRLLFGNAEFTLEDFLEQLHSIKKMGSLGPLMEKLPFFSEGVPEGMNVSQRDIEEIEAILEAMTEEERKDVSLFEEEPERFGRVAAEAGCEEGDVRLLLHRFRRTRRQMEEFWPWRKGRS